MKKIVVLLAIIAMLLVGCSAGVSQEEYDELLEEYEELEEKYRELKQDYKELAEAVPEWPDVFNLDYIEYEPNYGDPYYKYEITNTTHTAVKEVCAIISVETSSGDFLEYSDHLRSELKPGETITYYLELSDIYAECEALGVDTEERYWFETANLVGFEWE